MFTDDTVKPELGKFYTMGRMKHACQDRGYAHDIWEVVAINEGHAMIKALTAKYPHSFGATPQIVLISEFDFYPADDMVAVATEWGITREDQP